MWDKVASIAGKGVGFAGEKFSKAVEAASYVGEVIAPVAEDTDYVEVRRAEKLAWGSPGHEATARASIADARQGSEGEKFTVQQEDLDVPDTSRANGSGGQRHVHIDDRPPSDTVLRPDGGEAPGHEAPEGEGGLFASGMGMSPGENDVEVPWPEADTMDNSPEDEGNGADDGDTAPAQGEMFTEVELGPDGEENGARSVWDGNGSLDAGEFSGARGSEVRILADTVASLEQEVADLRSSVEAAERRAREAEERSRGLERLSEDFRRTLDSAHAELLQGSEYVAEGGGDLSLSEAGGLGLEELARSVAACMRETAVRHKLWRARLEQLVAATAPRGASPEVNGSGTAAEAGVPERVNALLTILEEEASTSRDSKSSAALQERSLEVLRLGEELSRQRRTNDQLKLVIDQMRGVSRTHGNEATILREQLEAMARAKASADSRANDAEELLERAKRAAEVSNASDEEKELVVRELKQAQQEVEDARATVRMIQVASGEELESCRALHNEVLQREQQLRSQLKVLTTDLALARQDRERHESALEHLRGVLEAFQSEKQTEVHSLEAKHKREVELLEKEHEAARAELKRSHDAELSESKRKADAMVLAERRGVALREGDNIRLRDELHKSRAAMDVALLQLQNKQDDTLDRRLVTNLIVRYVTSREKKQVLELAARILNFSEEELELVGLKRRGPTLPDLLTSVFTASPDDRVKRTTGEMNEGASLSEMWMDFLMTESDDASSSSSAPK